MAISVICPGCHKRFKVSDQFAGKQGPCPGCKVVITIPTKEEEVVIHAPEQFGPKGASGESVLKPIEREEMKISPVMWAIMIGLAVLIPLVALVLRFTIPWSDVTTRRLVLGLGALLIAPPLVMLGYSFLRDGELAPYRGNALLSPSRHLFVNLYAVVGHLRVRCANAGIGTRPRIATIGLLDPHVSRSRYDCGCRYA